MKKDVFKELYTMDLTGKIEKDYKGLSYLSWANAYKIAVEQDPNFAFEVLEDMDGFPLFSRGSCHMVKTSVTMFRETKKMFLPVMNNKHQAVETPNSRDINDTIMRCLVKNIALFGIGLSLYTGEDTKQYTSTAEEKIKEIEKEIRAKEMPTAKELEAYLNKIKETKATKEQMLKTMELTGINPKEATKQELNYYIRILSQQVAC